MKKVLVILILILELASCSDKKQQKNLEYEILGAVLLYEKENYQEDAAFVLPPPPPPPNYNLDSNQSKEYESSMAYHEKEKALVDNNNFLLIIEDNFLAIDANRTDYAFLDYDSMQFANQVQNTSSPTVIDTSYFEALENFHFQYRSMCSYEQLLWKIEQVNVAGYVAISLPIFNKEQNQAVVCYTYTRGLGSGAGYIFYLRKTSDKWKVVNKQSTWVE